MFAFSGVTSKSSATPRPRSRISSALRGSETLLAITFPEASLRVSPRRSTRGPRASSPTSSSGIVPSVPLSVSAPPSSSPESIRACRSCSRPSSSFSKSVVSSPRSNLRWISASRRSILRVSDCTVFGACCPTASAGSSARRALLYSSSREPISSFRAVISSTSSP